MFTNFFQKKSVSVINIKCAYFYITLPVILFLVGWLKWYFSLPCIIILIYFFFKMCSDCPAVSTIQWNRKNIEKFVFIAGIIALWVYFSGIGMLVFQNTDHNCRNAVYEMMVTNEWPIVEEILIDGNLSKRGLIYYIGFWLPAAVIGKLFGIQAGYFFQVIWAWIGISIFYYLVCNILQEVKIWPLVTFIFFSGLDIVGYYITGNDLSVLTNTLHLEPWSAYQFSSFTTQLFWVFNQAIPAWIIMLLILNQQKNKYIIFLLGLSMLSSTFPFIGMIPFALCIMLSRKYTNAESAKKWINHFLKDTFSLENILGGGIVGILSFLYLKSNVASQNISNAPNERSARGLLMIYIVFIILEVGIYWIVVYKYQKQNPLFYLTLIWLCICPFISVGYSIDFCMRASIPALLLLYIFVIQTLQKTYLNKDYFVFGSLMLLLIVGSITPIHEINRTITTTTQKYWSGEPFYQESLSEERIFQSKNFSGEIENSFFFKYLAK